MAVAKPSDPNKEISVDPSVARRFNKTFSAE